MKKLLYFLPIFAFSSQIKTINYEGLIHMSPVSANALIKIAPNSSINIKKINESIKALYSTGYFQTIKADLNDSKLTFICLEKPTISQIEMHNVSNDLKKLLKQENLMLKKGTILNNGKIRQLKQFIQSYYLAKGYFDTTVKIDKIPLNKIKIKLIINVAKGKKVTIRKVNFFGAKLSKNRLEKKIENKEKTFWSFLPFFNSGTLNIYKLIKDKENLQDYYLNLGYLDSKVSTPLAKINLDSYITDIDYKIKEGPRYVVQKISINYPKNIKAKLPELNLKTDKYFNVSALRKDIKNITHAFQNEGYAYVKVYPQIKKKDKSITVIYNVIPGQIVYINNVIISGNSKTLDRVIRRNIYLAPGNKYSYKDIKDSKNTLQRSGYLEDVKIIQKKVSDNKIDLLVKVKEGLSGSLKAGISYGSYTKAGLIFTVSEKNVFGSGQSLSANADINSKSKTYSISLFNPRILDSKYSFNTSIFNTEFESISYTSKEKGFSLGLGKKLTRNLSAGITYGFTKTKLNDYDSTLQDVKPKSTKSYIVNSLNYNSTDNYYFPTTGQKAALSLEFAGLGGDENYIKTLASYKYFHPFTDSTYETIAVAKFRLETGYIKKTGYLPINEKFYLGGPSSVRGFSSYSISPKDSNNNKIGGKYKLIIGPEISTPINLKRKMWLTGFIDWGGIGENSIDMTRSSYGAEFDWITPMGPIAFIWAWPIKSKEGDDLQKFEFSLGTNF